ncbi:CPBP family intramembrane glutamic endopeptidase [Arenimonas sp. MALMAid1274]|uniref:CPBP family intramembrane glutamic endopeptidase n=1 Tax=Arenimonas sp. MALMAid1274 TaxID=3411630 RepID=UPI003BA30F59
MSDPLPVPRSLPLRILQFPLVRLVLLAVCLLYLMALSGAVQEKFTDAPLTGLGLVAVLAGAALAVYSALVRRIERRSVHELSRPGMGRELGIGMLIGAGLYTLCVLILMALGIYRIDGFNPVSYLLPALAMALSSGVFEELIFRGVVFRILEESLGGWIALAASSLLFGLVHLTNPQATLEGALFISVEAGVLLAAAYMLTRRLWMSMGFHMAWNYTQSAIFSGIVSGTEAQPGLIQATIQGPDLLTGGNFGLESSIIAFLLCTTTGVVLLWMAARRGRIVPPFWKRR